MEKISINGGGCMKKNKIFIILSFITLIIIFGGIYYYRNYTSLEKCIRRKFSNAVIHKVDPNKKIVLFTVEGKFQKQYIVSRYTQLGNLYFNYYGDEGFTFSGPFSVILTYKKGAGNIIWGTFDTKENIKRVEFEFKNEKGNKTFNVTFPVEQNLIFGYPPSAYESYNFSNEYWRFSMKAFNTHNDLVMNYTNVSAVGYKRQN